MKYNKTWSELQRNPNIPNEYYKELKLLKNKYGIK